MRTFPTLVSLGAMTASEMSAGRYMRAEDHTAGTPTPTPAPVATVTEQNGVDRVAIDTDPKDREKLEGDANNQLDPNATEKGERPEGLPEGFDTWQSLLEAVQAGTHNADGTPKEGTEAETPSGEITEETQAEINSTLEKLPEAKREGAKPLFEEFAKTGALSAESKAAAAALFGVTEEMVDIYVQSAQTTSEAAALPAYEAAGGKEAYDAFATWAEANYTPEQKAAFNAGLDSDPAKAVKDAVDAWKAAGHAPGPRDLTKDNPNGPPANPATGEGYASVAEMQRDMGDDRYAKDPAFRATVEKRVGASNLQLGRDVTNG